MYKKGYGDNNCLAGQLSVCSSIYATFTQIRSKIRINYAHSVSYRAHLFNMDSRYFMQKILKLDSLLW